MPITSEARASQKLESAAISAWEKPNAAHELTDCVAKKIVNVLPVEMTQSLDEVEIEEWKRLLRLHSALVKVSRCELSNDEYAILFEYGCAYVQGVHLQNRVRAELSWFEEKKAVLDGAAGISGFIKRGKLEGRPIADWFDVEYRKAFPDGTFEYLGYDYPQTVDAVNRRMELLKDPEFGNPSQPLLTLRARAWRNRLDDLVGQIRDRRPSEGIRSDYSDLMKSDDIWLPIPVITAFALAGMSNQTGADGFSFWTDADDASDGDSDGGGGGGAD